MALTWQDLNDMVEGDPLELRDRAWAEIERLRVEPTLCRGDLVTVHGPDGAETRGRVVAFGNLAGPLVVTTEPFQVGR